MPTVNNGDVPYGSTTATIASVAYVLTNFQLTQGSTIIERRGALNQPTGFVITPDFKTGSCSAQRPTSSAAAPAVGDIVDVPSDAKAGFGGTLYISEVGITLEQGGVQMIPISLRAGV